MVLTRAGSLPGREEAAAGRRPMDRCVPPFWSVLIAGAFFLTHAGRVAAQDSGSVTISEALRTAIHSVSLPDDHSELVATRDDLMRLHDGAGGQLIWTIDGRPTAQAHRFLGRLRALGDRGLRPAEYDAEALTRWTTGLGAQPSNDVTALARFDVALSLAAMRAIAHLHAGRIDPHTLGFDLPRVHDRTDLPALALDIARSDDVERTMDAFEPPYADYRRLTRLLARYRGLVADSTLRPPRAPPGVLRPGDPYDDAPALRLLLAAFGDLPSPGGEADEQLAERRHTDAVQGSGPSTVRSVDSSGDSLRYDVALVDAVTSFQRRHGLVPDGILGPATVAALRVPLGHRVAQIELTLERWRWLPDSPSPRYVLVNIPAFRLDLFDPAVAGEHPALTMKIIAGAARGHHETPVFLGTMREVVFRPYWDVPLSIARAELVPAARRDPTYLERQQLEIVHGGDDDAVMHAPTPGNLDRVVAGTLRLRQRPGPDNALGLIKFIFPNAHRVYLHGTPATQLFSHARRDFSHGCIRIEDPNALAGHVLRDQAGWNRAAIDAAAQGTVTRRIEVREPLGVYVFYATAVADADGLAYFLPDIYGHDARLREVLAR